MPSVPFLLPLLPAPAGVILWVRQQLQLLLSFTRTCGGDPLNAANITTGTLLLPAPAGVILTQNANDIKLKAFTRTCGGDPCSLSLGFWLSSFYPHLRG